MSGGGFQEVVVGAFCEVLIGPTESGNHRAFDLRALHLFKEVFSLGDTSFWVGEEFGEGAVAGECFVAVFVEVRGENVG